MASHSLDVSAGCVCSQHSQIGSKSWQMSEVSELQYLKGVALWQSPNLNTKCYLHPSSVLNGGTGNIIYSCVSVFTILYLLFSFFKVQYLTLRTQTQCRLMELQCSLKHYICNNYLKKNNDGSSFVFLGYVYQQVT